MEVTPGDSRELDGGPPRELVLHGHRIAFLDRGEGPVLLFIHGILGSNRNWADLVDRLVGAPSPSTAAARAPARTPGPEDSPAAWPSYRVLAPDLFGHGASAKPMGDYSLGAHAATLRDLLDELGVDRVTLIGHSLGGGVAMQFCYLFPQRVDRLVLVSSGGLGRSVSPLLRSAALPGAELVLPVLASGWVRRRVETVGRLARRLGWRAGPDVQQSWRGFASLADAESRRAFLATTRAVIDPGGQTVSAVDHLRAVRKVPTLVVWGTRDRMIPSEHADVVRELVPGSQVELFEGAGHFPHLDQPERFVRVLRDFIAADAPEGRPDR